MEVLHRENMILYNVLNQEIIFEEYFCNLLSINKFRTLFINFISKNNNILDNYEIEYNNFATEVMLNDNLGRADLFLKIGEERYIFEIKNKDWTSLTHNQPCGYIKYLNDQNEHLFFLIPRTYKHKKEIYDRWKNFDKIDNQIFYWEEFIKMIKTSNLCDEYLEIKLFYEFCEYWFNMRTIKFEEKEMKLLNTTAVPNLMEKLEEITRQIALEVGLKEDSEAIGFNYTKKTNDYKIYFGIDYTIWMNKRFPLRILIQNHKVDYQKFSLDIKNIVLEEFEYKETNISDEQFGYLVIPDEEVGSKDYKENIISTLQYIIKELNQT